MKTIAILLTVHNRKEKTLNCLNSIFKSKINNNFNYDIFITDDGCTDGTVEAILLRFPNVHIVNGNGNLYWAGGMREAWKYALEYNNYDYYLLINDDTLLNNNFITELFDADNYARRKYNKGGIYLGATLDPVTQKCTYGGRKLLNKYSVKSSIIYPNKNIFQNIDLGNGNIMMVCNSVVDSIGILSSKFTHGLADFDYTLVANKNNIPVLLCRTFCGECINDHGKNWKSIKESNIKERIDYLLSPTGLACFEYIYFIKKHFIISLPITILKLILRTLFPFIWDRYKINK
ncbi:MAG: hypothetical protein BGO29_09385 [Bacteroidales bacterium 36-12]|nr:MAG: hypothetical protein BGO29_09385 [Bacteroidales bacterium 36-12]